MTNCQENLCYDLRLNIKYDQLPWKLRNELSLNIKYDQLRWKFMLRIIGEQALWS